MLVCQSCIKSATGIIIDSKNMNTCCLCSHVDIVADIPRSFYLFLWEENIANKNKVVPVDINKIR